MEQQFLLGLDVSSRLGFLYPSWARRSTVLRWMCSRAARRRGRSWLSPRMFVWMHGYIYDMITCACKQKLYSYMRARMSSSVDFHMLLPPMRFRWWKHISSFGSDLVSEDSVNSYQIRWSTGGRRSYIIQLVYHPTLKNTFTFISLDWGPLINLISQRDVQ